MENKCGHAEQLAALERKCRTQAAQITHMREALERKNRELDALHMVWCDGGCRSGVHRWTDEKVSAELVAIAERNTRRLKRWYRIVEWRLTAYQGASPWLEAYALRNATKTDLLPDSGTTPTPEPGAG